MATTNRVHTVRPARRSRRFAWLAPSSSNSNKRDTAKTGCEAIMKDFSTLPVLRGVLALCLNVGGLLVAGAAQGQSAGPQGSWSAKAPLPLQRSEAAVGAAGGKIYVLGGGAQGRIDQPLNQEYDP